MARYNWKYLKKFNDEFSDVFILQTQDGVDLKVLCNFKKRIVKIKLDFKDESVTSTIVHGVILKEQVLNDNRPQKTSQNLKHLVSLYSKEIGTVPSSKALDLINGNYDINKTMKGKIRILDRKVFMGTTTFNKGVWNFTELLLLIINAIRSFFRSLLTLPQLVDIMDVLLIGFIAYLVYWQNYSLLSTGITVILLAFLITFYDLLRRSREIYLLKFFTPFVLGLIFIIIGLLEQ